MGYSHDDLANKIGEIILKKLRTGEKDWQQVFSTTVYRVGDWEWPRPDYVIKDDGIKATYAHEFKPPNQSKREYLTGVGQALSYLQKHDYSGLIVPKLADDNFPISEFIKNTLSSDEFKELPISLIEYDEKLLDTNPDNAVRILKAITKTRTSTVTRNAEVQKTFWGWWRDASHYEVFDLLVLSDKYIDKPGDIYTDYIYEEFYSRLVNKETKQWNGEPRKKKISVASKKSEKQNYKIPLFHLGLWNQADGRITKKGYKLLIIGKLFGPESREFLDYLTYLILTDGKHLELINQVRKFQKENEGNIPSNSDEYLVAFENYLDQRGLIGARKPGAVKTGAKESYIRDEPKLWNHLGLLERKNKKQYFFSGVGLKFKWDEITKILMKDFSSVI